MKCDANFASKFMSKFVSFFASEFALVFSSEFALKKVKNGKKLKRRMSIHINVGFHFSCLKMQKKDPNWPFGSSEF